MPQQFEPRRAATHYPPPHIHLGSPQELTNQQGQYHDPETGLHYNRHRYYNPNTGRFITPDPIGLAGGLNNYQYVPNPTGWVDPLGLTAQEKRSPDASINTELQASLRSLPEGSYRVLNQVDTPEKLGFANNRALEIELLQDVDGVRFYGGDAAKEGAFVAVGKIPNNLQHARQHLALSPFYDASGRSVYNTMDNLVDVRIQKAAKVLIGEVAPQQSRAGKLYSGGGSQILTQHWLPENSGKVIYMKSEKVR